MAMRLSTTAAITAPRPTPKPRTAPLVVGDGTDGEVPATDAADDEPLAAVDETLAAVEVVADGAVHPAQS